MDEKKSKQINEESLALSNHAKEIESQILEKGVKIEYFFNDTIEGRAASLPPNTKEKIAKIYFRDKKSITDYTICHELLHIHLFVVRGYSMIKINSYALDYKESVVMLDNIFSHTIMTPNLRELNYFNDFINGEYSATKKYIDCFKKEIEKNPSSMDFKTLSTVLYVRAQNVGFTEGELKQFEEYLKKQKNSYNEILYDEKAIKAIRDNLPQSNCSVEDYHELLKKCIKELNLIEDVDFECFEKNSNSYKIA